MTDKTALVTGAARGIGLATTKLFLAEGWRVAMIDRDAETLADECAQLDGVLPVVCDVSDPAQVDAMVTTVLGGLGRIDALVNNAGVADFGPIEETTFERWRTVMATNLDGVFLVSQACIPALKETRGAIVNIASITAHRTQMMTTAYCVSKAGVDHLTRHMALESARYGIRVNAISPGYYKTAINDDYLDSEAGDAMRKRIQPDQSGQFPWFQERSDRRRTYSRDHRPQSRNTQAPGLIWTGPAPDTVTSS